jgi:Ran GTPase-activating protein (RanGAP) involved in mRNA processing and transport
MIGLMREIPKNIRLRSLNIAYNSIGGKHGDLTFEELLSDYIHSSKTLLHLDMSGMSLPFSGIILVC